MKRILLRLSLALTLLTLLGLARLPALAADPPKGMVPFKIVITTKFRAADEYVLPFDPPLLVGKGVGGGSNELLGQVSYIELGFLQLGVDGSPVWMDAMGAFTAANGDALYFKYKGAVIEPVKASFIITGGKGRFKGASGSGVMTPSPVPGGTPEDSLCAYDGFISAPLATQ